MTDAKDRKIFYEEIFNHNGASYHAAMELVPNARDEEFNTALSFVDLKPNDVVLDVPAGGGYLKRYLPDNIEYHAYDFSIGFGDNDINVNKCTETSIPMADNSVDYLFCLAAMHHVENRLGFYKEAKRVLKDNGTLIIADALLGGEQDNFLNTFVDQWNSLGHKGDFMQADREAKDLVTIGFESTFSDEKYYWTFDSPEQARSYCRLLFALNKNPSDTQIDQELQKLGTKKTSSQFLMGWRLGFITAKLTV